MSKVLRMTDRIKLTISGIDFYIAPLAVFQKHDVQSCTYIKEGKEYYDLLKAQSLYIKYALKKVVGLKYHDESDFELKFDANGDLSDESINEIFNMPIRSQLNTAAFQLLNGLTELQDPLTGEKLKGVEMEVVSEGNY